jgi:uncharacterized LabA/DUF88 family protein
MNEQTNRITLLVDAENVSYKKIDNVISQLANLGKIKRKIAYANWTKENLKNWESIIIKHSIQTVQQFDYTKGKNASDIKLVVDAMKILYSNTTDAFCIVASDSDYAPLIQEIRTHDLPVYGFGEKHTPEAFKNSCSKFFYFDKRETISSKDLETFKSAVNSTKLDDGWSYLNAIENHLQNSSSFSIKNYSTTLLDILSSIKEFRIKKVSDKDIYVKLITKN